MVALVGANSRSTIVTTNRRIELNFREDKPGWTQILEHYQDVDELIQRLTEIEASRTSDLFIGVTLQDEQKNALCVGLAETGWAVLFFSSDGTYRQFSVGDDTAVGEVEFRFQQWESFPARYLTKKDIAERLIREWCESGNLSVTGSWERERLPFAE